MSARVGETKKKKKKKRGPAPDTGIRRVVPVPVSDTDTTPKMPCPCNLAGRTRLIPKWVKSTQLNSFQPRLLLRISQSLSKLSWFKSCPRPRLATLLPIGHHIQPAISAVPTSEVVVVLLSLSLSISFPFSVFKAPPFHCLCFRLAWVWGFWLVRKKVGLGVIVGRSVGLGFCLV